MRRIIVCVKPVPDPKHWNKVSMDNETGTLKREGIPTIMNPLDKHALEAALTAGEEETAEVVLLSMAPPFATATLREGLAMGADRAVLLSDPLFAGSDTLATAHILAAGCRWIGAPDLLLCGNLSVDGATGQVCCQTAEFLDLPSVMHVVGLQWKNQKELLVTQKIEQGQVILQAQLPLDLAVRKEVNKPRYTSFAGILAAESKEIRILSSTDLKIDKSLIGLQGSPTKMAGMRIRRFQREREKMEGTVDEIAQKVVDKIYQYGII